MENEGLANTDFYVSVSWNIKEFDKEKKVGLPKEKIGLNLIIFMIEAWIPPNTIPKIKHHLLKFQLLI